jgi:biotin-[acetyl-CoA-carboxylase] ligase BirA-like protein
VPVYTDVPEFARTLLPPWAAAGFSAPAAPDPEIRPVLQAIFGEDTPVHAAAGGAGLWRHLLVRGYAEGSQYERLIRLARAGAGVPHGVACVARGGGAFQGFRGRSWVGSPGNVHLAVHLAPRREIERFESVFLALAAVSVLDAVDAVPGLAGLARVKWVNDVLLHGAKVAGVLAYTQTRGASVTSVVLGIGVNVEVTPAVRPTAFVPAAGSLREHAADPAAAALPPVLAGLLRAIERNYGLLLEEGYRPLVARYRARSAVLGQEVQLSSDDADEMPRVFAAGRVVGIGDGLELILEGAAAPVARGRLILGSATAAAAAAGPRQAAVLHPRSS